MADEGLAVASGDHLRLAVEGLLEFVVVDPRITGGDDDERGVVQKEGHGLGDVCLLAAEGLRRQRHRGGGPRQIDHPVLQTEAGKVRFHLFKGHRTFSLFL